MNAKKCKSLRKIARNESQPGEPLSQLVAFRQFCTPLYNPVTKQTEPRITYCAVNNPHTFRGRYRNLKSGRSIDIKRIAKAQDRIMPKATLVPHEDKPYMPTPQKQSWIAKMREKFNRVFRTQHR